VAGRAFAARHRGAAQRVTALIPFY